MNFADLGLPEEYLELPPKEKKAARFASLQSWFDLNRPSILCTNVENYVKAHRLWVEFYLKPAKLNRAVYFRPDPGHKYRMARAIMSPALVETEPAKTVIHAPRGTTKTVTCIREACSMIACVRPDTKIVLSEQNGTRTAEEVGFVREQIEQNEIIHRDFGGMGRLYPGNRATTDKWSAKRLDFIHNRSSIVGVSVGSSHRGRHPLLWIIDDPEPEEGFNEMLREKYFRWLFRSGMGMLSAGAHMFWLGTPPNENACLMIALRGVQTANPDGDDLVLEPDHRFDDWTKIIIPAIKRNDETGLLESVWPEYISVDGFEAKRMAIGEAAAMAEYQGEIVAEGTRVLHRHEYQHGFMVCKHDGDLTERPAYMLDLRTGESREWKDWLDELVVFGAVDPADSLQPSADPGALVIIGIDKSGIIYALDCVVRKQIADGWVEEAFPVSMAWSTIKLGWEKNVFQTIIYRNARKKAMELSAQGLVPPLCVPVDSHTRGQGTAWVYKKALRIIGLLRPLLIYDKIRFRRLDPFSAENGAIHYPAYYGNRANYHVLKSQIDRMTDRGTGGHDDAADALYMAIRVAGGARGSDGLAPGDPNELKMEAWKQAGLPVDLSSLPYEAWTPSMKREYTESMASDAQVEPSGDLYDWAVYE